MNKPENPMKNYGIMASFMSYSGGKHLIKFCHFSQFLGRLLF